MKLKLLGAAGMALFLAACSDHADKNVNLSLIHI